MKLLNILITLFLWPFFQVQAKNFNFSSNLFDSIVMFQDQASGKCFQLKNLAAFDGNTIELNNCDQTDTAQQFYLTERSDGSYKVTSMVNKRFCIDKPNRRDADLIVWSCHPDGHPHVRNQKVFIDKISGKTELTISFGKSNITYARVDGNNIKQTLNENDATVWKVSLAKDFNSPNDLFNSTVMLEDQTSNKCFRLKNGSAFNGNIIELNNCDQTDAAQQFYLTERSDGSYKATSMVNKRFCIDKPNRRDADLIVWSCHRDGHPHVRNQKVFIDKISGKTEVTISFGKNSITYARVDGNNINQTLNENDATVWKVLLQDVDEPISEEESSCNVFEVWNGNSCVSNGWPRGDGTKGNPYMIESYEGLKTLSDRIRNQEGQNSAYSTAHYKLENDIDASTSVSEDGGFQPIGYSCDHEKGSFKGSFDGANFEIRNLTINRPDHPHVGLFGCVSGRVEIKNLVLKNFNVLGKNSAGVLVGRIHRTSGNARTFVGLYEIFLTGTVKVIPSSPVSPRPPRGFNRNRGRSVGAFDDYGVDLRFRHLGR